jgi:hypothetical protein
MANPNAPYGLRAVRSLGKLNSQVNEYVHAASDATALFIGDAVVSVASSSSGLTAIPDGTPVVTASGTTTTGALRGAVAGVRPTYSNLTLQYAPASTAIAVLVNDDPDQTFTIQSNGTVVVADIGKTAGITAGTGSTVTGQSAYVLTESTVGTSTDCLLILRLAPIQNNALGANGVLEVKINVHELNGPGSAGV